MTFNEWFERRFPEGTFPESMGAMREAFREVALDAWGAATLEAEALFDELERQRQYDASVFVSEED